jgi:hypothetical protein
MDTDEVQMQVLYEWYSGLVARQLAKDCGKHPGEATVAPPWYRVSQGRNSSPRAGAGPAGDISMFCFGEFCGRGNGSRRSAMNPGMVISAPRETCRSVVERFEDSRRTRQKAGVSLWL